MRFPPKSYNKDLESAEDRREREAQVRFIPVQLFPPRGYLIICIAYQWIRIRIRIQHFK
jgi:hypothetical protein